MNEDTNQETMQEDALETGQDGGFGTAYATHRAQNQNKLFRILRSKNTNNILTMLITVVLAVVLISWAIKNSSKKQEETSVAQTRAVEPEDDDPYAMYRNAWWCGNKSGIATVEGVDGNLVYLENCSKQSSEKLVNLACKTSGTEVLYGNGLNGSMIYEAECMICSDEHKCTVVTKPGITKAPPMKSENENS